MTDKANTIATWLGIIGVIAGTVYAGGQMSERFEELQARVAGNRAVVAEALQSTTQQEAIDYLRHLHAVICSRYEDEGKACPLPPPEITPPIHMSPGELTGKE